MKNEVKYKKFAVGIAGMVDVEVVACDWESALADVREAFSGCFILFVREAL